MSIIRGNGLAGSVKGIEEVVHGARILAFQNVLELNHAYSLESNASGCSGKST